MSSSCLGCTLYFFENYVNEIKLSKAEKVYILYVYDDVAVSHYKIDISPYGMLLHYKIGKGEKELKRTKKQGKKAIACFGNVQQF